MQTIFFFFKKSKEYILYTFLKYVEYGILAFIFMSFADKVSPSEYGYASIGFQVITYSAFIVLGVNQVLLKWHAKENNLDNQYTLITYNQLYNLASCILLIVFIYIFLPRTYSLYVGIICGLKLIQESAVAINRVKGSIKLINLIYLSYSISFLIFYLFLVKDIEDFFKFWSISIAIGAIIGILTTHLKEVVLYAGSFSKIAIFIKRNFENLFFDGIKLATITLITPLFATLIIILLNLFVINKSLIGNFQLADNISNVVALGGASVLFILLPNILKKINANKFYIKKLYKQLFYSLIIIIVLIIISIIPITFLINYFFSEYSELNYLFFFSLLLRILLLALFVPSSFFTALSMENKYIKINLMYILIMALIDITVITLGNEHILKNLLPAIPILFLLLVHFHFYKIINKNLANS